jgi:hypothetical protein
MSLNEGEISDDHYHEIKVRRRPRPLVAIREVEEPAPAGFSFVQRAFASSRASGRSDFTCFSTPPEASRLQLQ